MFPTDQGMKEAAVLLKKGGVKLRAEKERVERGISWVPGNDRIFVIGAVRHHAEIFSKITRDVNLRSHESASGQVNVVKAAVSEPNEDPSPLKSPTAKPPGYWPTCGYSGVTVVKVPSPLPSKVVTPPKRVTTPCSGVMTTKSRIPSPLKSPTATPAGLPETNPLET